MRAGWRGGVTAAAGRGRLAGAAALCGIGLAAPAAAQVAAPACWTDAGGHAGGHASEQAVVREVLDGRTIMLADGRAVRLTGLEDLAFAALPALRPSAIEAAKAALRRRVMGETVLLQSAAPQADRYGRRLALVRRAGPPDAPTVQEDLLSAGEGLVAARVAPSACAALFLAAEARGRAQRLGLWGEPYYDLGEAARPADLAAARGRFAIVEGKVLSVRDRGATIYVNFGRRWSQDFTVTIAKRNLRRFVAAGLEPKQLAGHRVRVRGWIDERGGPWIEASAPGQIEFADRK